MTLQLDYQSATKPFPWAGVILLAVSAAALALTGIHYSETMEGISYWEAKAGQAGRDSRYQVTGGQRDASDMALEIKRANEVLNQITLPWDRLFQAVEWSSGKNVALLTIEPDAEKREVKISGEGKDIAAVLDYIRHLASQEVFSSVYLQSHKVERRGPEKPVRFALVVSWKVAP